MLTTSNPRFPDKRITHLRLQGRTLLTTTGNLQVICEVADGPEAVQKAGELKPELILLDVGLLTLNGIEAARQIRFLGHEDYFGFRGKFASADMAQEALCSGARATS